MQGLVLDPRTLKRPYLSGGQPGKDVSGAHIEPAFRDYTQEIHRVLTSELIQRHLVEKARTVLVASPAASPREA
ncbi:MAG: hypothetical protein MZU79_06910 [Anaerotruncus sp.]|nr:hypothetical protein [Anaerotruncus sp.]